MTLVVVTELRITGNCEYSRLLGTRLSRRRGLQIRDDPRKNLARPVVTSVDYRSEHGILCYICIFYYLLHCNSIHFRFLSAGPPRTF